MSLDIIWSQNASYVKQVFCHHTTVIYCIITLALHLCVLSGTREVAKPKPKKKPEEEEMAAATVIQPKAKAKDNFFVGLIDRQLEEDSICGKVAQFFTRVNIL